MAKMKATTNKEMKLALIKLLSDPGIKIKSWGGRNEDEKRRTT